MIDFSVAFKVSDERNCPFYEVDDLFVLSAQSVQVPAGHPTCLILVRELTNLLFTLSPNDQDDFAVQRQELYTCGGCTGLIKFRIDDLPESLEKSTESAARIEVEPRRGGMPERGKKSGSDMSGVLEEISPSELFQFFHMHQKTGKLLLHVPDQVGRVAFREGAIIGAKFGELENKEAIFAMLGEHSGRFSFASGIPDTLMQVEEIGDFMMLLMEGIKRLDESRGEEG